MTTHTTVITLDRDGIEASRHKVKAPATLDEERDLALIRGKIKDMTRSLRACGHAADTIRAALLLEAGE